MTETSPVTTWYGSTTRSSIAARPSAGDGRTSRSRSPTRSAGRAVARGEAGEFQARGYPVMRGYWNDPERTAEVIDAGRWMHTGDLATMDEHGYVRIVGRIKDMIIRGGENVYPREIEEFLHTHPNVADVQVIGVPDERYGEELMAWIVPRAGHIAERRVDQRVLPRPDRPLQDPALRQVRRRLPDDGHRQGAEVQDARAGGGGTRARAGRGDPHRLSAAQSACRTSRRRRYPPQA